MCDIAGYTGFRRAAPVLIDMMRREEGFCGGYYTGIATVDNGKVYYAKVVGDLNTLLTRTDAYDLPGNIGILQSRTPSGGGREWAYPFISCDEKLAFVENGFFGHFAGQDHFSGAAQRLENAGHVLKSKTPGQVASYDLLPDGTSVHYCDVYCHLAEEYIRGGLDPLGALTKAVRECPSECVTVSVHASLPDSLLVTRYNMPMFLKRAKGEAFLATTPLAFPSTAGYGTELLPANIACAVTPDGVTARSVLNENVDVQPITPEKVYLAVRKALSMIENAEKPVVYPEISQAMHAFFSGEGLSQFDPLGYMALEALVRLDRVQISTMWKKGMEDGLLAPVFSLTKK